MNPLTVAHFERWLEAHGRASAQNLGVSLVEFADAGACRVFREQ